MINDFQSFFENFQLHHLWKAVKRMFSYDIESLLTSIPVKETIDYLIDQICAQKKLTLICMKLICNRLLLERATECKF